ncbi:hypothetical protein [Telmatospirillum sp. J64-1]|uniref:hypothetical protein n=1 Tax=Telmatospirillum sp. J64-1 TaxID=2502183 RepID=UPI00115E5D65|nr:hypothetical protein [Telmatospirillum sp. J64-1]
MPQKTAVDVGIGTTAAALPWWAVQSQHWMIWIAAICGGLLALGRLWLFALEVRDRRRVSRACKEG